VRGGCKKLYNEGRDDVYLAPNIVTVIKLRGVT